MKKVIILTLAVMSVLALTAGSAGFVYVGSTGSTGTATTISDLRVLIGGNLPTNGVKIINPDAPCDIELTARGNTAVFTLLAGQEETFWGEYDAMEIQPSTTQTVGYIVYY